jgi:hypothetical protein
MVATIRKLKIADAPDKRTMLDLLTEMRKNVVAGKTLALVAIEIQTENGFTTHVEGDLTISRIVGLLTIAQLNMLGVQRK